MKGFDPQRTLDLEPVDFGLRLMFYRGIAEDIDSNEYLIGYCDFQDGFGQSFPGVKYALRHNLDDEYSLYHHFFKDYIYWFLNLRKEAKAKILLSASQLSELKPWRKIRIKNQNYLYKSHKYVLKKYEIKEYEFVLYSC
ncbi:MAG: hypothetical protein HN704_10790 [Bacteroidetes bacterium]|jgi:hypothetical protein|nr:hypothetical protein [Bacteroidota bacterium]MBT6835291.1 hypothetical protein [Bacteroidota bacterium]MBT7145008.1 hypothetical protein [Bacteroidota bacterium]MBT7492078.1 hypothetical protein [Bacteroidota bacterium]